MSIILYEYHFALDLHPNLDNFSVHDQDEFSSYAVISKRKKMDYILDNLEKNVWQH